MLLRLFVKLNSELIYLLNCLNVKEGVEEIKWQTYTGELTPTQEKTKEKVLKLLDKVSFFHFLCIILQFMYFVERSTSSS